MTISLFLSIIIHKKDPRLFVAITDLTLGQKKNKVILEHLTVLKSKEVLTDYGLLGHMKGYRN